MKGVNANDSYSILICANSTMIHSSGNYSFSKEAFFVCGWSMILRLHEDTMNTSLLSSRLEKL